MKRFTQRRWRHAAGQSAASRQKPAGDSLRLQLQRRVSPAHAVPKRQPAVTGEVRQLQAAGRSVVKHAGRQQPNPQQGLRPATKGAAAHRQQGLRPAAAGAAVHRQQELSPEAADAAAELSQAVAVTAEAAGPLQRAAVHQGIQITAAAHREDKGHRAGLLSALIISQGAGKNNPAPFISLLSG